MDLRRYDLEIARPDGDENRKWVTYSEAQQALAQLEAGESLIVNRTDDAEPGVIYT